MQRNVQFVHRSFRMHSRRVHIQSSGVCHCLRRIYFELDEEGGNEDSLSRVQSWQWFDEDSDIMMMIWLGAELLSTIAKEGKKRE